MTVWRRRCQRAVAPGRIANNFGPVERRAEDRACSTPPQSPQPTQLSITVATGSCAKRFARRLHRQRRAAGQPDPNLIYRSLGCSCPNRFSEIRRCRHIEFSVALSVARRPSQAPESGSANKINVLSLSWEKSSNYPKTSASNLGFARAGKPSGLLNSPYMRCTNRRV